VWKKEHYSDMGSPELSMVNLRADRLSTWSGYIVPRLYTGFHLHSGFLLSLKIGEGIDNILYLNAHFYARSDTEEY